MPVSAQLAFRRITVITDFSDNTRRVYAYAANIAKQTGADLLLVHFGNKKAPDYSSVSNDEDVRGLHKALAKESRIDAFKDVAVKTFLLERRELAKSLRSFEQQMNSSDFQGAG